MALVFVLGSPRGEELVLWGKGCLPKARCKRVMRQRGCLSGRREVQFWSPQLLQLGMPRAPGTAQPYIMASAASSVPTYPCQHTRWTWPALEVLDQMWVFFPEVLDRNTGFLLQWRSNGRSCKPGATQPQHTNLFADAGSWECSGNVWQDESGEECLCPRCSKISNSKTAKAKWYCTEQTWQNIQMLMLKFVWKFKAMRYKEEQLKVRQTEIRKFRGFFFMLRQLRNKIVENLHKVFQIT